MSTKLIAHLKKKCEEDGNVAILFAQWEFDQKLVGKALENIGGFYPHFSNHNASHSQQILVNIERILGNDIELLSATDTWLILEAAYWHDVGMLVDAKNAKEVHTNPDFHFMIQTIANEKGHDLQKFCQAYVENNWLSAIGTLDHPFDGVEKYRQLIAEWFRRGHDKRVGKLVEDPFKDLGITSPRTELLPNRIYRYLGQICVSHGMNFDTLMETIPYKQTGLGTENCHPRFIGCLLRLGDLFDLDDNRFCPVMAKHVSNMPSVSKHHHDKHLSLREFQLDKRTVKLVAECPDEMSYVETQNWFGWIREEFQNQMSQWNLIVPDLKFGSLPTIEQLDVRMQGNRVLLNNKPMKFSIDEDNAVGILEGSGLYKNDSNIYRELIQNAIDATLIKLWVDFKKRKIDLPKKLHPYSDKMRELLKNYNLNISFKKIKDIEDTDDSFWEFRLQDRGIGISLSDLEYMQKIAGSNKNKERQKIINKMPQWMRPSGQFGIGLHSAFLLLKDLDEEDQKITIISTNSIDYKTYKIELNSPLNIKKGYCFIEELTDYNQDVGTTLIINLKRKRRGQHYSWNNTVLYRALYSDYDPLKDEKFDYLECATEINDIHEKVLEKIFVPYVFNEEWQTLINNFLNKKIIDLSKCIWLEKYNLYFEINLPNSKILSDFSGRVNGGFKGQDVGHISYHPQPFQIYLMFFGLQAKEVLQTSRNTWNNNFEKKFFKSEILGELSRYVIDNHKEELKLILKDDALVDLFEFIFCKNESRTNWKNLQFLDVKKYSKIKNENCKIYHNTFSELLNLNEFNLYIVEPYEEDSIDKSILGEFDIVYTSRINSWLKTIFDEDWINKGGSISTHKENKFEIIRYAKKLDDIENGSNFKIINSIKIRIQNEEKRINLNEEWLSEDFFKEFEALFTKSELVEKLVGLTNMKKRHIILPFYIHAKTDSSDVKIEADYLNGDLIKKTWEAREEEFTDLTLDEFKKIYIKLEEKIKHLMKIDSI